METSQTLKKAKLLPIRWNENAKPDIAETRELKSIEVQFNPSSLKVTYANQVQSGDQSTGASMQYVGKGTSKLALELIFDTSAPGNKNHEDVRQLTREISAFMKVTPAASSGGSSGGGSGGNNNPRYTVPGVRFEWGTFTFDGVMESMDETLDLFSPDGIPLRATVSISLGFQGISEVAENSNATPNPNKEGAAGTQALTAVKAGASLQGMVGSAGASANWKAVASANNIENPRQIQAGTLLNLNIKRK